MTGKAIVIEFIGGFRDGQVLRSDTGIPAEVEECLGWYQMSAQGRVGSRTKGMSEAAIEELRGNIEHTPDGIRFKKPPTLSNRPHVYEVVGRQEDDRTIRVRWEYKGVED